MDLVEVRFGSACVLVRHGTTLLAAARPWGVDILTGCERGQCGTDAVEVRGLGLEPPGPTEQATLQRMGLPPSFRLSCSARVTAGCVDVDLQAF